MTHTPRFIDSKAVEAKPSFYTALTLDVEAVLKSWQTSVFSFEWMKADATIKPLSELSERDQAKRIAVEEALQSNAVLETPVLGIGIQDNIEIGSGKAVLCTLAAHNIKEIPAHIPKSNEEDFKNFIVKTG